MRNDTSRLLVGGILFALIAAAGYFALSFGFFALAPAASGSRDKVVVEIHKGQGPQELARLLQQRGAVSDARRFVWLGRLMRQWKKIKAGEYEVSPGMSPMEVFTVITSGVSIAHPVTVREGENTYEVAADVESKSLAPRDRMLALCRDARFIAGLGLNPAPPTLEGYLFPDTYFFNRTLSAEDMIRQMVRRFQAVWTPKEDARARELGMSRHEILTLASMIEKETGAPQERPLISSVFYNRLHKRMRLQSDPTTIYGMWERYKGNIHKSDLLEETPYNTYTIPGLPVGPIGNPGREAIQAALHPAQSDFLFFVSHNDGTHEFTRTLDEHNRAVRRFQLDPKAREGKSWRDLKKNTALAAPAQGH